MKENKIYTHPSYGMIQISKYTGGQSTLFGSSIKHNGGITLSIHNAELHRHLNHDWYHSKINPIISVDMSYSQFAEAITSGMNTSGIPCTIREIRGEPKIDKLDFSNKRLEFEDEFEDALENLNQKLERLSRETEEILFQKKPLNKTEKEEIMNRIKMIEQDIHSNIPYMTKCFNETLDKTVVEAKSEIEGFYESKVRSLGIEALENLIPKPEIE